MRRILLGLFVAAVVLFPATAAHAQTACAGPVAQITSPAPGSTLPAGAVTFSWCHASADYFLTIESPLGAANIYNAFVVGFESVTIGPACNVPSPTNPTLQCLPTNGEKVFVTLWTNTAQSGRKNFVAAATVSFTAANLNPPAVKEATTVALAAPPAVSFSSADQSVTLSATVTAASAVNQGNVTFRVLDGAAGVGVAVTSGALVAGSASATYVLPGGTPARAYTVQAAYSGGSNFLPGSDSGTLTIGAPPAVAAPTATSVAPLAASFSSAVQDVILSATVSAASPVNEGAVTFRVVDGTSALVGAAVTSGTLNGGNASVIYSLPAGLAAGIYTVEADYSDGAGTNFQASSGAGELTVNPPAPPSQAATVTSVHDNALAFSASSQSVTLAASVAAAGAAVNEGSVTFEVLDAAANVIGAATPSSALSDGSASVSYALPAGLAPGTYAIHADFSGGASFQASSGGGTLTVTAPVSTIADLLAEVQNLSLERKSIKELSSKLRAAELLTNRGKVRAAVKKLRDFIEEVRELQREEGLDAVEAASLAAQAESIISQLAGAMMTSR